MRKQATQPASPAETLRVLYRDALAISLAASSVAADAANRVAEAEDTNSLDLPRLLAEREAAVQVSAYASGSAHTLLCALELVEGRDPQPVMPGQEHPAFMPAGWSGVIRAAVAAVKAGMERAQYQVTMMWPSAPASRL